MSLSGAWAGVFAWVYDPVLWLAEVVGMRRRRAALLARAHGRTLELGAGTGLNLVHYPTGLEQLVLAEPEPAMRARLQSRAGRDRPVARVIPDPAEHLDLEDASVDTVVSTLVLCTVEEPAQALSEVARVLRPGGQLLFIEHVRSQDARLARWQDRLARPWQQFAVGCRCNRRTLTLMRDAGFAVEAREDTWRAMPAIVRPLISGRATLASETAT